jgi:hypothetical protein
VQLRSADITTAMTAVTSQSTLRARDDDDSSPSPALAPAGAAPPGSQRPSPPPIGPPQWMQRFVSGGNDVRQLSQRTS